MDTERTDHQLARGNRGRLALIVACLFVLVALPAAALAAKGGAKQGLITGFQGDELYESSDASFRDTWIDRTVSSGAGIVRVGVNWPSIVASQTAAKPADPTNPGSTAYNFTPIDTAVRALEARGIKVLL